MAEVDNLVLEQLRLIRDRLGSIESTLGTMTERMDDLKIGQEGQTGMLVALARYIHSIDGRVEHVEEKLGIK